VFFVGNLMIDSLVRALKIARPSSLRSELGLRAKPYVVLTLHRPSNVDHGDELKRTLEAIAEIGERIPVVFPAHPRTARNIDAAGPSAVRAWKGGLLPARGLWMMPPASYLDFLDLIRHAVMVITDSGGVQEETTYLGIPCATLRENTERPITISEGTNRLLKPADLKAAAHEALAGAWPKGRRPQQWDGHTAQRAAASLRKLLAAR
jgi:UDP-N-acetylglucosamine 2-epimerase (non-hydrolysing)